MDRYCRQAVIDSIDVMIGALESPYANQVYLARDYTKAHVILDLQAIQRAIEAEPADGPEGCV